MLFSLALRQASVHSELESPFSNLLNLLSFLIFFHLGATLLYLSTPSSLLLFTFFFSKAKFQSVPLMLHRHFRLLLDVFLMGIVIAPLEMLWYLRNRGRAINVQRRKVLDVWNCTISLLLSHVLAPSNSWACIFLMNQDNGWDKGGSQFCRQGAELRKGLWRGEKIR